MVIAGLKLDCFLALIKANGYEIVSSKYWELEGIERIVIGKDGHTFVIRMKKYFYYSEVIKRSTMLGLTQIPDGCKEDFEGCEQAYNCDLNHRKKMEEAREAKKSQPATGKSDSDSPGEVK